MPYTDAQKKDINLNMFGGDPDDSLLYLDRTNAFELAIRAQSILSDSQEELARDQVETARQMINRAKYVIEHIKQI